MDNNTDLEQIEKSGRIKNIIGKTITYILLGIWAIIVLFPFYWMILTSFKSYSSYNNEYIPKFYASNPTIQNYLDAFNTVSLGKSHSIDSLKDFYVKWNLHLPDSAVPSANASNATYANSLEAMCFSVR